LKRVTVRFKDKVANLIDAYRRNETPIPSFNTAVNDIIESYIEDCYELPQQQTVPQSVLDELNNALAGKSKQVKGATTDTLSTSLYEPKEEVKE